MRILLKLSKQLWLQVTIAMLVGIALGIYRPALGEQMQPLGIGFVRLVRMLIAPIIFCTVVHGIASVNDIKRIGRVAIKALLYFEIVTTAALILALVAVNWWRPGAGMHLHLSVSDAAQVTSYATAAHESTVAGYLLGIIPSTLVSAFVQSNTLQVLLIAVLFAFGLIAVGARAKPVLDLIDGLQQVLFKIVNLIMWTAPLGAFGAMAFTVGKFGGTSLWSLGTLILEFFAVCAIFVVLVLGAAAYWAKVNLFRLLYYFREELLLVAATTSTETVLPRVMQKMRALGCDESVVGLVVPTGYSFNLDGTCLYLAFVTVFLAQATDTPLGIAQQIALLLVLLLLSKGAAGVAGAALIVLAATLSTASAIPVASLAIIVGIHRLLAEGLTFVNLVGNCVATLVVARWENAVDEQVLANQVGWR